VQREWIGMRKFFDLARGRRLSLSDVASQNHAVWQRRKGRLLESVEIKVLAVGVCCGHAMSGPQAYRGSPLLPPRMGGDS